MSLARWKDSGGSREVPLTRKSIAPGRIPEGVLDDLRRTPRMIMGLGVAIMAILSFTSGVFGAVGLLFVLFGACLLKRRLVAANRLYALEHAEQQMYEAWQSAIDVCAKDHPGSPRTGKRQVSTFSNSPVVSGESRLGTDGLNGDSYLGTAPTPHSDAA
jgi:hypothetical protein